jgi:hypothetical protein
MKKPIRISEEHKDVTCENCGWSWDIEPNDKHPYLCHQCGHENTKGKTDEGAGPYDAPSFQMKPDHVHFKHQYNEQNDNKGYLLQMGRKSILLEQYGDEAELFKLASSYYRKNGKVMTIKVLEKILHTLSKRDEPHRAKSKEFPPSLHLQEQVVQGKAGDPYEYKKEGGYYYARKKGTKDWILTRGNMASAVAKKIFGNQQQLKPTQLQPTQLQPTKKYCPAHPKNSEVNPELEKNYQPEAAKLISKGIPTRTSCEISYIKLRPKFSNKSFFVFDGSQNLIYLFDKTGNFVAKSYVLDGADAQSQDTTKIAKALWTWQQQVENLGFKWDPKMQKYLDKSNKNRTYSDDLIYNTIDKNDTRFFPKGVYSIVGLSTDKGYAGGQNNLFRVETLDGQKIAQAIHGFYNEAPRVAALEQLKIKMGTSASPKSESVPQEFLSMVEKYKSTQKFNKSYGCINLPTDFLKIAKPYSLGAMLFVIGETKNNYLVQNADTFFQKMGDVENCSDPASVGTELPNLEMTA